MKLSFYFLILLTILPILCRGQEPYDRKSRRDEYPPSAVLVQLRTGQKTLKYLERFSNTADKIKTMREDLDKIVSLTVEDFTDNFVFCPVYFFYDTNWHYIIEKKFDGVLLNKELKPVIRPVNLESDTTYFILTYGEEENEREIKKQTLLSNDYKGHQLGERMPYKPYRNLVSKYYRQYKQYSYVSKSFNLEYRGFAKAYSSSLDWFYSNYTLPDK